MAQHDEHTVTETHADMSRAAEPATSTAHSKDAVVDTAPVKDATENVDTSTEPPSDTRPPDETPDTTESPESATPETAKESEDAADKKEELGTEREAIPVIVNSNPSIETLQSPHPNHMPDIPMNGRPRSDTLSTVATQGTPRSAPISSMVFVTSALDTIAASKEARRSKELEESVKSALANIKQSDQHPIDPEIIFKPLELASKTLSIPLQITALDCIGKLITYSYFAFPSSPEESTSESTDRPPLIERAIETICDCFENEATPPEIQQQIVKSLLAAVLNDKIVVHGAGLLKAVRQIYNIFIYSKSSENQHIAQGSLTQMVGTVFDRVRIRLDLKESRLREAEIHRKRAASDASFQPDNGTPNDQDESAEDGISPVSDHPVAKEPREKMTLQSFETNKDEAMVNDNAPTMVTRAKVARKTSRATPGDDLDPTLDEEDEIYVKDAFLVFRALCKLSHKILSHDQQQDLKSQNMRSKLLSLHLMQHLLNNHVAIFISPLATIKSSSTTNEVMTLLPAIRPHLCLSLSRNGASAVPRVFEVCCEIFWLMLKHMRVMLKKELEVFFKEIYLAILEKRNSPIFQKQYFMDVLGRLSSDPRALVELYLNYDCDRTALENMFQGIIEQLSRMSSVPVAVTAQQQQQYQEHHAKTPTSAHDWHQPGTLPPSLSTARIDNLAPVNTQSIPPEYAIKQKALDCLVEILRSLDTWSSQDKDVSKPLLREPFSRASLEMSRESLDTTAPTLTMSSPRLDSGEILTGQSTPVVEDDPKEIEKVKQRKIALTNAIRQFNFKPKRGMKLLLSEGFTRSDSPADIANFLLRNDRLDKAALGEFLGEGDAENIAIMHAFVDLMDFGNRGFVDALREFLQSFRLPGESQKIDRFMLKFAERYLTGNPKAFATADDPYVLAYSVIMLNTDLHSSKLKRKMSKDDFIRNNRDLQDVSHEYLGGIYDEIANNEIVLFSERAHAANLGQQAPAPGLASRAGQVLATVGRDIQGERYAQASEEIANKTEQLYRSLIRAQKKSAIREALSRFIPATSVRHVGSMFNVTWMSFLSGLSAQVQETHNLDTVRQCMEGIRLAIRISCAFDLETPRVAFVTGLAKFTNLGNLREMMAKNLEALKILLDVAVSEGNNLKSSWREVLTCISQLDRLQLLTDGVDEGALPDMSVSRAVPPSDPRSRKSLQVPRKSRPRSINGLSRFGSEVAMESRSAEMVRGVDRIFTNTANLSQDAIVDFVWALSNVSWQEIQSSGQSESPRTYSLQKLVEISYYNMTRVRIEWSRIWEVLGEHFNQVGCHTNTAVVFFALDSLRQLSMRFLEIEELPGFKFQKDFLKPFEHVMANSTVVTVKDMVLRCLIQMIQARGDNIRSGWKTMFGVFSVAAREPYEGIVNMSFEHVTQIYNTRFGVVITQGAFPDMMVCLTQFSKNLKFQKKSLQAIETLKSTVPKMLRTSECPLSRRRSSTSSASGDGAPMTPKKSRQTAEEQFWYPILIAFQDVLMTGDDLEVRSKALIYLFEILTNYGGDFPADFWDVLWRQLLYPIFVVLHSKSEMSKVPNHEELSVWLSTTMIQALRQMIGLFTHYFDSLEYMLDRFLGLLTLCICQENDTIARIGSNCLQQLIIQNVQKFQVGHWDKIVGAFEELFEKTTAYELFTAAMPGPMKSTEDHTTDDSASINQHITGEDESTLNGEQKPESAADDEKAKDHQDSAQLEDNDSHSNPLQAPPAISASRRRFFNRIITNCVLQLLMIETVNELFSLEAVYDQIPSHELLRLMLLLKKSYQFAKKFNEAKELRVALWKQGFMKQPPNLLKQESGSAATYVSILFRMYHDEGDERKSSRKETEEALIPLCADIIQGYNTLDEETQQRNISAWRPVVVDVVEGYTGFARDTFDKHIETFYPLCVELLSRDVNTEIRLALQVLLRRMPDPAIDAAAAPLPPALSTAASSSSSSSEPASDSRDSTAGPLLTPFTASPPPSHHPNSDTAEHLHPSAMPDETTASSTGNADGLEKKQEAGAETLTPKTEPTPCTLSGTENAPKKALCKKHNVVHGQKADKSSKKKKKKAAESSSSDSDSAADSSSSPSSSSSSSDSSDSDSEDSSDYDAHKKSKKKKKKKRAKERARKLKQKKKAKKEESSTTETDSDSDDNDASSDDEKAKKARLRAKKKARKAKKLQEAETEDDGEADDGETQTRANRAKAALQLRSSMRRAKLKQSGYIDKTLLAEQTAQQAALLQQQQRALQKAAAKAKKQKRASKVAYKRIDQLWDNTLHNYKLTETVKDPDANEWDQYIFTVRRRFDWDNKYIETLVDIKSKALKEALTHIMDGVKSVSLVSDTPAVDPNMLFLYLEECRAYVKELKAAAKATEKKKARKLVEIKATHLKMLVKYLDKDYADIKKTLYPLLENNTITFDLLWALFKPNTIVYTPTYGAVDEPRAFKLEYATKESSFMKGQWYSIEGRYLEYDGKSFGMGNMTSEVDAFKGPRKITSLACYPIRYHRDAEALKLKLVERGKKFVSLQGMNYRFHQGMAFFKKRRSIIKVNINGRVMVDPALHRRINPNYPISTVKPKDADNLDGSNDDSDDEGCCCGGSSSESERPNRYDTPKTKLKLVHDKAGKPHIVEVDVDENGNEIVKEDIDKLKDGASSNDDVDFTEEELLIASPVVLGFAFSEKLWLEFTVSGIKDIEWNTGAFESLVLPGNQKSIVKALVESHTFHAAENIDDVIQGKGKGLVAVLHGPPGTGKTLTAEGIAELLKRPLYMVSAGELGTDSRTLEGELNKILDIAHSWGAVLLLDEADVFLEKRTIQDIHRNALVSIFLRLLEYFQGILFLTTNRVETFDDAFQSRIHVALRYGDLTTKAKRTVWKMFLDRVRNKEGLEVTGFTEKDYDVLARHNLNGRQIKNSVRTAQALAINENTPLSMEHINRVLDVAETFEQDLKGGTGYMDAMRSYT
ncbi:guanine nucleotide exchange protein for ADP-robosylation factor [Ophidiomyces ophidiicola]|nr:guanine nucleotide exchange protein for ADP-robosylation factor [Ophidiomyces ophidiicola]